MDLLSRHFVWTVVLLAATLAAATLSEYRPPDFLARPLESIDSDIAGWRVVDKETLSPRVLSVLLPTSYLSWTYQKQDRQLSLFISFYAHQRTGETMHSPKNCLPGAGWEIWKQDSAFIPVQGQQLKVNKYSIQNSGRRSLVFYWYQSRRRVIASEYLGKILLVRDALLDSRTAASIVRIILPDVPGATEEGVAFAAALIPQMQRCFGR